MVELFLKLLRGIIYNIDFAIEDALEKAKLKIENIDLVTPQEVQD